MLPYNTLQKVIEFMMIMFDRWAQENAASAIILRKGSHSSDAAVYTQGTADAWRRASNLMELVLGLSSTGNPTELCDIEDSDLINMFYESAATHEAYDRRKDKGHIDPEPEDSEPKDPEPEDDDISDIESIGDIIEWDNPPKHEAGTQYRTKWRSMFGEA